MTPRSRQVLGALAIVLVLAGGYVLKFGLYPRYFDIEWDEEVQLHDGRMIVVHVKRTFERRSRTDRWLAHDRDTEVTFDAGPPWGKISRNFERYDVKMIEQHDGNWFFALRVTTGIPPKKLVDPAYTVLILEKDGTERPAKSWDDIPDFPRQNIMPVTPSPEGILPFANSLLTWKTKMEHWKNNPRAAGDNGLIIQRHTNQQGETK
ncbi:hypothetical protein Rfer_2718 [Rhodoferax ferrireducens T118]|uniref:Uncharacterized protein n=1 Tax=Albidiferax ferrireducens (strain ATCC BAA-621 / DSM 15236 / T118) TaxID=338969 RepID=Q21UX1_ALBFT|nr:hypothetical protein [Rhodoferax ferrireducens]ABD70432.1 hypothetical protein Rfer_2718 [Rhodoferax ferrireducens T118]